MQTIFEIDPQNFDNACRLRGKVAPPSLFLTIIIYASRWKYLMKHDNFVLHSQLLYNSLQTLKIWKRPCERPIQKISNKKHTAIRRNLINTRTVPHFHYYNKYSNVYFSIVTSLCNQYYGIPKFSPGWPENINIGKQTKYHNTSNVLAL